ncbi:MAG TPA: hypothetical protein PKD51_11635 [Saprospiraceae bacterium]|nr:hypothetical protein [Saprospiraceae bacterium]HMU02382.1 hypothetical protein [Saprospiraceae bacterium]
MKLFTNFSIFVFALLVANTMLLANGEPLKAKLDVQKAEINAQFDQSAEIEALIKAEGLTYAQLMEKYPDLTMASSVKPTANEEDFFARGGDVPLGIPGFWWGFFLGIVGMAIVYFTMDEGSDRKKQVMNALWGCIAFSLLWVLLIFVVFASAATVVSSDPSIPASILSAA